MHTPAPLLPGDFTHRSGMTATTADGGDSDLCGGNSSLAASSSRPASSPAAAAARNVRGSRPSSAAIAAQIEGFDNDFMVLAWHGCWLLTLAPACMQRTESCSKTAPLSANAHACVPCDDNARCLARCPTGCCWTTFLRRMLLAGTATTRTRAG